MYFQVKNILKNNLNQTGSKYIFGLKVGYNYN
jgi:hypothetical protein